MAGAQNDSWVESRCFLWLSCNCCYFYLPLNFWVCFPQNPSLHTASNTPSPDLAAQFIEPLAGFSDGGSMEPWTCRFLFKSKTNIHFSPNFGSWEIRDPVCLLPTVFYPLLSKHTIFTGDEWKTCFISFSPFILKGFRQQYLLWEWQQMQAVALDSCVTAFPRKAFD